MAALRSYVASWGDLSAGVSAGNNRDRPYSRETQAADDSSVCRDGAGAPGRRQAHTTLCNRDCAPPDRTHQKCLAAGPHARRSKPGFGSGCVDLGSRHVPGGVAIFGVSASRANCLSIDQAFYPVRAVQLLEQTSGPLNLAVHFNWGEYVIWHLGPHVKVSIDGRRETVYASEIYRQNSDFMTGHGEWDRILTEYNTDTVLVPSRGPAANLLRLSRAGGLWWMMEQAHCL